MTDSSNQHIDNFLRYCQRKNLLYKLPGLVRRLERLAARERDQQTLKLSSAQPLTPSNESAIRRLVGAPTDVAVETELVPALIGGFVAEFNNYVYDGSAARQVARLQETLID